MKRGRGKRNLWIHGPFLAVCLLIALWLQAAGVLAQSAPPPWERSSASSTEIDLLGWGFQCGLSVDPNQVLLGGHADVSALHEDLLFRPLFELGLGDDVTTLDFELDASYLLEGLDLPGRPYAGVGISVIHYSFDTPKGLGGSETETGINLIGGLERELGDFHRAYLEIKLGVGDVPDLKLVLGFSL